MYFFQLLYFRIYCIVPKIKLRLGRKHLKSLLYMLEQKSFGTRFEDFSQKHIFKLFVYGGSEFFKSWLKLLSDKFS